MTTVAAIDCGTNSIKLLIMRVGSDGASEVVLRDSRVVRLGQGIDQTGMLAEEALVRTFAAVEEFADVIGSHGVPPALMRFCATSATRDASNAAVFTEGVRRRLGVEPEVLSGEEEAALVYAGATSSLPDVLPEPESNRYQPITPDELQRIAKMLQEKDYNFYCYCLFIFYAFIRPGHICNLQRWQIDFEADTITILGKETKSKRNATKQLLTPLKDALIKMGANQLPADFYLFGTSFIPGKIKCPALSRRAVARWKQLVIDGLGIDKKMYALKHTSGQLFISENEGLDSSWLPSYTLLPAAID